jgi:hypothetical protein
MMKIRQDEDLNEDSDKGEKMKIQHNRRSRERRDEDLNKNRRHEQRFIREA